VYYEGAGCASIQGWIERWIQGEREDHREETKDGKLGGL
jgi:hypothetical protein